MVHFTAEAADFIEKVRNLFTKIGSLSRFRRKGDPFLAPLRSMTSTAFYRKPDFWREEFMGPKMSRSGQNPATNILVRARLKGLDFPPDFLP